jgi:guanylate kinase
MAEGKLIVFSAPSGSGKTTIVKRLLEKGYPLEFSISACNRLPREGEMHGKDYYFLSTEEFQERIANNELLEWEEVYQGRFYGTLKSELNRIWGNGKQVLFDVDVVGGSNIKKQFGNQALAIFIQPPSVEELRNRLEGRGTDNQEEIEKRLAKAQEELAYAPNFDHIVVNDNLEEAIAKVEGLLKEFLVKQL